MILLNLNDEKMIETYISIDNNGVKVLNTFSKKKK